MNPRKRKQSPLSVGNRNASSWGSPRGQGHLDVEARSVAQQGPDRGAGVVAEERGLVVGTRMDRCRIHGDEFVTRSYPGLVTGSVRFGDHHREVTKADLGIRLPEQLDGAGDLEEDENERHREQQTPDRPMALAAHGSLHVGWREPAGPTAWSQVRSTNQRKSLHPDAFGVGQARGVHPARHGTPRSVLPVPDPLVGPESSWPEASVRTRRPRRS